MTETITKPKLTTWLVTFWQGGQIQVSASTEQEALIQAARSAPWAQARRVEAWD